MAKTTPAATRATVLADQQAGTPYPDLEARYGISRQTIRNWAKAAGLPALKCGRKQIDPEPIALTGGRWVLVGLIWRYIRPTEGASDEPRPGSQLPLPSRPPTYAA